MSNIKEKFYGIFNNFEKSIKDFIVTYISIFLTTFFLFVTIEATWVKNTTISNILTFGIIVSISVFFIENYLRNDKNRIVGYVISAIVGILFTYLIYTKNNLFGINYNGINEIFIRIVIGYCIILILFSIYKLYKNTKEDFNVFFAKAFQNIFKTTVVYGIFNIGLMILSFVFIYLLLENSGGFGIYSRIQIALLGFIYIPGLIIAISQTEKVEINKFIKTLTLYVLLPLIIIGIIIIYLYMAKVFITGELPSNMIYRIIAGIFIVTIPTWIIASIYRKEYKLIGFIINIIPFVLIPFLYLQTYSMNIRVEEYGITPLRYISYIMILYEMIAIILMLYKKSTKLEYFLVTGAVIVFVIFISPLNFNTVSNISQKNILVNNIKKGESFTELSKESKKRVLSSYIYLKKQYNYKKYIPEYVLEQKDKIMDDTRYVVYKNINYNKVTDIINVENYRQIAPISYPIYNDYTSGKYIEILNVKDSDFNSLIKRLIEINELSNDGAKVFLSNNDILNVTENKDLYIKNISIQYDNDSKEIISADFSGYILVK